MGNMSYCQMENTSKALGECFDTLQNYTTVKEWVDDTIPSVEEKEGLLDLLELCYMITEWRGDIRKMNNDKIDLTEKVRNLEFRLIKIMNYANDMNKVEDV